MSTINTKRNQRKSRIRKSIKLVSSRPRLTVYRSNKHIWVQIVDDSKGNTLVSISTKMIKKLPKEATKTEKATILGEKLAELALKKKVKQVYFDRGSYKYHGRIKAFAEAARKEGLEF